MLFEGKHWRVQLHHNQSYLGRSKAILKRELLDPLECTAEERDELWEEILPKYRQAVNAAFKPIRINYAHLANADLQVHWHLVPRYEDPNDRTFEGITFVDTNVGHNFAPHPDVPDGATDELVQAIRVALKNHLPA
ncbi:MAG TPA: hypothetical protein VIF43_03995 [Patescibacteria group bacterium]